MARGAHILARERAGFGGTHVLLRGAALGFGGTRVLLCGTVLGFGGTRSSVWALDGTRVLLRGTELEFGKARILLRGAKVGFGEARILLHGTVPGFGGPRVLLRGIAPAFGGTWWVCPFFGVGPYTPFGFYKSKCLPSRCIGVWPVKPGVALPYWRLVFGTAKRSTIRLQHEGPG